MEIEKNKNQVTTLIQYGWNLFLFARTFRAEVDASPDEVADALGDLQSDYDSTWMTSQHTTLEYVDEDLYNVDMRVYQHMTRTRKLTAVKGTGRILYSKGYETTIIQGDIRLGWFNYVVGLIVLLGFLGQVFSDIVTRVTSSDEISAGDLSIAVLILAGVVAFIVWQLYRDYQKINKGLQNTLLTLKERSDMRDNTVIDSDYLETEQEYQQTRST